MLINKELGLSIFYFVFGLMFAVAGTKYELGTLSDMGTGYFPVMIGCLLMIIAVINYLQNFNSQDTIKVKLKIPLIVSGLIFLTYALTEFVGFIFAISILIWGSAYLHPKFSIKGTAILNVVAVVIIVILKYTLLRNLPI